MSHSLRRVALLAAAVTVGAGGCGHDGSIASPSGVQPAPLSLGSPFRGVVTNVAAALDPVNRVARVSLPPGTMKGATSATIANRRTGRSTPVRMVDAGFDPVPITAQMGDTILVAFGLDAGDTVRTWAVVPATARPVVVRTDPQSLDRDVPVGASVRIIFSEPLDPASVSSTTITLTRNGVAVAGRVEVLPQQPWIALFTPTARLAAQTTFELLVSDQVRDLDDSRLESPTAVSFTTTISPESDEERIAFSSWSTDKVMIYTMSPDGSRRVALVEGMDPNFSPDGTRIAFWRFEKGRGVIFVANVDGSNAVEITEGEQPTWSPDGRRLAYACGGICLINVDGSGLTRVTPSALTSADGQACVRDSDPTWSPDGSTIAFTRWPDARIPTSMCLPLGAAIDFPFDFWTEVWLIDADGSNPRPVRDRSGNVATYAGWPSWSPNGKELAFYATNGMEERIDIAGADGSWVLTAVARSPLWNSPLGSPAWSPDGSRILFGTADGWGFADASGSMRTETVRSTNPILPSSLSWSWSRR